MKLKMATSPLIIAPYVIKVDMLSYFINLKFTDLVLILPLWSSAVKTNKASMSASITSLYPL